MRTIDKYCGDLNSMTLLELVNLLEGYKDELNPIEQALLEHLDETQEELLGLQEELEESSKLSELAESFGFTDRMDYLNAADHAEITDRVNSFGAGELASFLRANVAVHEDDDEDTLEDYAKQLDSLQEFIDRNHL